jgi:hypothetical protein
MLELILILVIGYAVISCGVIVFACMFSSRVSNDILQDDPNLLAQKESLEMWVEPPANTSPQASTPRYGAIKYRFID